MITIGLVLGLVLLNATALVAATPTVSYTFVSSASTALIDVADESTMKNGQSLETNDDISIIEKEPLFDSSDSQDNSFEVIPENPRSQPTTSEKPTQRRGIKFKGLWGYDEDNTTQGYVGGVLRRKCQHAVLLGRWNRTGSEETGKIIGKFHMGYFAGRVENPDGQRCHIIGLYKVDKENQLIKMKWMTPHQDGWAVFKYLPPSEDNA